MVQPVKGQTHDGRGLERFDARLWPSLVAMGDYDDFQIHRSAHQRSGESPISARRLGVHGEARLNTVEAELTTWLASTARVREAAGSKIGHLLLRVDARAYTALLAERGLLALLGSRAIELAAEAADGVLRSSVDAAKREARLRALALDSRLREVVLALEDDGIPALPFKGTTLADRLYGDTGLRPTTDVDLLVARAHMARAVRTIRAIGYPPSEDPPWTKGLPLLHHTFAGGGAGSARVELHWRVHWSERHFSDEVLRTSSVAPDGLRRAEPPLELALLLLVYARDGLYGPRLAVDIAAWWDRLGHQLAPGALDGVVARDPSLRRSLVAALVALERFVGLPARGVLTDTAPDRSTRRAVALADPLHTDEHADVAATVMIVDALLSTGRDKLGFLRRYYLHPLPYVRSTYHLEQASTAVVACRSAVHAVGALVKKSPRMIRAARRSPQASAARRPWLASAR
jgi:Uncharacterised nucleotidyltransferase